MYTAKQAATLFNVAHETIRKWAVEFEKELSPTANPGDGRQRIFVDDDLAIFALIAEMKQQGKLYADIHVALANDQRGRAPAGASALALSEQPRATALQVKISHLETQLTAALDSNKEQSGVINELRRQLTEAHAHAENLVGENAVLKHLLRGKSGE
ncbi:MAG: MerR family transcriptional regulator [Chloroflexota bacterium]